MARVGASIDINFKAAIHVTGLAKAFVNISAAISSVFLYVKVKFPAEYTSLSHEMETLCVRAKYLLVGFLPVRIT